MAHKTLIGGTAYEITGGKTLVNGTAYSIDKGKTLVGGTAYEIGFGFPPLSECTPAQIQAAAESGQAANYWAVGDKIGITLNGTVGALTFSNETYYAFIIGFNHNSSIEGNNTIHFQFGKTADGTDIAFVDSSYNSTGSTVGFRINTSNTNVGGWKSSYMRNTICSAFLSVMPTAWQNVIKACTKYTDNTGNAVNTADCVTSTSDKIWLLAEWEVLGARKGANSAEQNYQKQYDYYKNGGEQKKYAHNAIASSVTWWYRSPYPANKASWCRFDKGNPFNYGRSDSSFGIAPGFMVA